MNSEMKNGPGKNLYSKFIIKTVLIKIMTKLFDKSMSSKTSIDKRLKILIIQLTNLIKTMV